MKKLSFFGLMATVMIAATFASCTKEEFMDDLGRSSVNLPTPQMSWNDSIVGYMPCGNADELEYFTRDGKVFTGANPFRMSGNVFVRQGNSDLSSAQSQVAVSATPILWPYNHSITDTLGRINDTVVVTVLVGGADSVEARTFKVAPMEPLKVYMSIEHSHPTGAAGFVDNAKMHYTLATTSNAAEWCCKWQSRATIYEKVEDTIYVDTTSRRKVGEEAQGYHRQWLGNWGGTGNTRTIQGTNTMVVTSYFNMAPMTEVDSAAYPCSGTLTVTGWHTYSQNMDGRYYFDNNGNIPELGIHATTSWNRGPAYVNGHDYTAFAPMCNHSLGYVDVNGTTATVVTFDGSESFNADWTININTPTDTTTPTPADTVDIFGGQLLYWAITASYRNSAQSSSDVDWFLCVVVNDNGSKRVKYSPLATTAAGWSFTDKGVITNAEYTNLVNNSNFTAAAESGLRSGLAMAYHHNDNTILDITRVKYSSGTSQVKYYTLSGALHSAHSAIGQTLGAVSSEEPVREGGVKTGNGIFTFIYNGEVVK